MSAADRGERLARLEVLVGEWALHADIPGAAAGRATFEWALGGQFLVQRTEVPDSAVPDSVAVIRVDLESGALQQHYFDSRGVVRLYEMSLEGGVWRLQRDAPDFSPLPFHQRFIGKITGDAINGRWERSDTGEDWDLDFGLDYRRVA